MIKVAYRQAKWSEPLVYELGSPGKPGLTIPDPEDEIVSEVGPLRLPENLERGDAPPIPGLSEVELSRHLTRLSEMSYGVDSGPLPLGSCTMKYNPRIALKYAYDDRITMLHPLQDDDTVQGVLEIMYRVQEWLAAILGMDACSLHPAAGAHGELAGVLMIRRYHSLRGDTRDEIIVPDSAHGTNPASAAMAGFKVVEVPTASDGNVDLEALRAAVTPRTAGLMITNPSTLGLFEENILEIASLIHDVGGLLYYDGANLNGIMGYARPGDMGFDIAHVNLHKTFSSPHGGGGPGSGPVCVRNVRVTGELTLADLLPGPRVIYDESQGMYRLKWPGEHSIGLLRAYQSNTAVVVWAYTYMLMLGAKGLRIAGEVSVLNTNYLLKLLEGVRGYSLPFDPKRPRKHEAVISASGLKKETGVTAEDIAKALLDAGLHAPTIYFPLIVEEALMIELTESETLENIEAYAARLREIAETAYKDPQSLKEAPKNTSKRRIDLVKANHPKTLTPTWRVKILRDKGIISSLK